MQTERLIERLEKAPSVEELSDKIEQELERQRKTKREIDQLKRKIEEL